MKYLFFILIIIVGCQSSPIQLSSNVTNAEELEEAIKKAEPGAEIVMANGNWTDVQIEFIGNGTAERPIILRAETPGQVFIQGESDLKIGGKYLIVEDLYFNNGYSPSSAVIDFQIDDNNIAFHCQVNNCVIEDFNKLQRDQTDLWVEFRGRNNQLSNCYLAGKSNRGPTVRVNLEGIESIKNYHNITNNYFGPRPPKGGPSAETIQIGNSYTSMSPSYTMVANNYFDRCNGEVEIISSKTNFNEFRNNVFYKSEGSLVTRHGNYCIVDGNYFIGDENSEQIGGIRLIGTGHWVTNNYFYNLKGQNFRSPLAVMNGIPKSPLNRYIQVTDVVVAYNTWIDCLSPMQFGVGSNVDQKDVLPASEIRSAIPIRTTVANNLIYNSVGDPSPVVAHDKLEGINFQSNVINNQGVAYKSIDGINAKAFELVEVNENIKAPSKEMSDVEVFSGFEFETISKDLFGNSRLDHNSVGAIVKNSGTAPNVFDKEKYGPDWYVKESGQKEGETHIVNNESELVSKIESAKDGDRIKLNPGNYKLLTPIKINKSITIESDPNEQAVILYAGPEKTPAFEMNPKGQLTLKHINLKGEGKQYAFASLKNNMSSLYNLTVDNCMISDFDYLLKGYKYSFSENIKFNSTSIKNCNNGIDLSEEIDDKGEYNAENIFITNCEFEGVDNNVVDYYRGGYDESTVGGNLVITKSTFTNCGSKEETGILINTYGIINVDISGNTFKNNKVKQVALLWGAKNNVHSDNTISNSGKIVVEENLKLKLLY